MAACCQCRMCTDLCSRNLLGHPIEPHAFMRGATTGATKNVKPFLDTMFCSQCGICEMYACGQDLSPRTLIGEYKNGLRASGVKPDPNAVLAPVDPARFGKLIPVDRLTARLGLAEYDKPAPIAANDVKASSVKIMLSQCIGVPAAACVKVGDTVNLTIAANAGYAQKLYINGEPLLLDYTTGKAILKLLQDMSREKGMTVIIITHNSALTAMADRVIKVRNGTIRSVTMNENPQDIAEIEW